MEKELTKETYITNHDYMSFTRWARFMSCEAAAAANYKPKPSQSLLEGSYVDTYFSGEFEEFKTNHPEIFNSRTGELKSNFLKANEAIKRVESDAIMMEYLSGEKQYIVWGEIFGVKFKGKIDDYAEGKHLTDFKYMKDFQPVWTPYGKRNFIEAYYYNVELAIFQELAYQRSGVRTPAFIDAITKETPEDVGVFSISQPTLDNALNNILKPTLPRIQKILNGEIEPRRCENCEYCRMTKKARVLNHFFAGMSGDQLREEGIESNDAKIVKKGE